MIAYSTTLLGGQEGLRGNDLFLQQTLSKIYVVVCARVRVVCLSSPLSSALDSWMKESKNS